MPFGVLNRFRVPKLVLENFPKFCGVFPTFRNSVTGHRATLIVKPADVLESSNLARRQFKSGFGFKKIESVGAPQGAPRGRTKNHKVKKIFAVAYLRWQICRHFEIFKTCLEYCGEGLW